MKPDRLIPIAISRWLAVPSGLQRLRLSLSPLLTPPQANFAPPLELLVTDTVTKHDVAVDE